MEYTVALFGEAEKGQFHTAYHCTSLEQLSHYLGEPPTPCCRGLEFAIQALLFKRSVVYFRVHEEGFSNHDYIKGLNTLIKKELFPPITAIGLPGVGCDEIIEATDPVCSLHNSLLILSEKDLYDYLTARS